MSEIQKQYLAWYKSEQAKGLIGVNFVVGNVSQSTVDDLILEIFAIEKAIQDGRHTPLPETF